MACDSSLLGVEYGLIGMICFNVKEKGFSWGKTTETVEVPQKGAVAWNKELYLLILLKNSHSLCITNCTVIIVSLRQESFRWQ